VNPVDDSKRPSLDEALPHLLAAERRRLRFWKLLDDGSQRVFLGWSRVAAFCGVALIAVAILIHLRIFRMLHSYVVVPLLIMDGCVLSGLLRRAKRYQRFSSSPQTGSEQRGWGGDESRSATSEDFDSAKERTRIMLRQKTKDES
jgi:hypothetical protein